MADNNLDLSRTIGRALRTRRSPARQAKEFFSGPSSSYVPSANAKRALQLRGARPTTEVPNTQRVDYDTYKWLAGAKPDARVLSRNEFQGLAASPQARQFDEEASRLQQQRQAEEQRYEQILQGGQQAARQQQAQQEFQQVATAAQESLQRIGQGDEGTAQDFRNIATTAAILLDVEGDDEEAVNARTYAAQVLSEYGPRLSPHLDNVVEPGWLANNSGRIDQILEDNEPQGFDKWKARGLRALEKGLDFTVSKAILNSLGEYEQGMLRSYYDLSKVVDPTTPLGERADYARDLGATLGRVGGSIVSAGGELDEDLGFDPAGTITVGGRQEQIDRDESGDINIREMAGLDPEAGGFAGDIADLIGTVLLDPLTYASFGTKPTARLVTRALTTSQDDVARKAGFRMANGARMADLSDIEQLAVRATLKDYQAKALANPRNHQLWMQRFRSSPADGLRKITKSAADDRDMATRLVDRRTVQMTTAAERGLYPAVRIFGRKVLPMKKLYNALGIIDTRLAQESGWTRELAEMVDLENADELYYFIQSFDGQEMTDELRDQMRQWDVFANRLADDPVEMLDNLLQRSATGQEDRAFDQIEAFGRELFGDDVVAPWRQWYEESWAGRLVRPAGDELGDAGIRRMRGFGQEDALARVGDTEDLRRVIDEVDPTDFDDEALARIGTDLQALDKPVRDLMADDILPRGVRALANKDTRLGRLVSNFSDAFSPRAGMRRTRDLRSTTADEIENLTAVQRAMRAQVIDDVNMLDIDRAGNSRLAQEAEEEIGEDIDRYLNRIFAEGDANVHGEIGRLREQGHVATADLLSRMQRIRENTERLSVLAGADEAAFEAMEGYIPRTFTDEARQRAARAARPGGDPEEIEALRRLGLGPDDSGISAPGDPLGQAGSLRGRTYRRDLQDLFEVNESARQDLRDAGLSGVDGFELYETNPIRATLMRSRQAHEAYAWMDMVDGMSKLVDLDGRPLAYIAKNKDELIDTRIRMAGDDTVYGKAGSFVDRDLPNGGKYWVRREINEEIEKVNKIIRDPSLNSKLRRHLVTWNDIWGAWATVPLVGTAFHARNATGNIMNMILAGVKNPAVLGDAARLQRLNSNAVKAMREFGIDYPSALRRVGADDATVELLRDARKFGIIGGGETADVFSATDELTGNMARGGTINPLKQENYALQAGRGLGQAIENNARLGLFIDGRSFKGMSPEDAASRVRKHLFDYKDLTPTESNVARMLNRFYTFTRKNTALQARLLATQPGRVHNAHRISQEFTDQIMSATGFDREGDAEAGMNERGERIPDWVPPTMGFYRNADGEAALVGLDSTLVAGAEAVDDLASFFKMPGAISRVLLSGSEQEKEKYTELFQDHLRASIGQLSGGPVEGVKTAAEFATQKDLFTGADLSDMDRNFVDTLTRVTDSFMPVLSKIDREAEYSGIYRNLGVLQPDEGEDRSQGSMRWLNAVLGMNMRAGISDPEQIEKNHRALSHELNSGLKDVQRELEGTGVDVPQFEEWMEASGRYNTNQVIETLIYDTLDSEGQLSDEELERLGRLVPKNVRDAIGLDIPARQRAEWDVLERGRRVREIISALEVHGIEVTPEMEHGLLLRESGITITDLKSLGIEPAFQGNPYVDAGDPKKAEEMRRAQGTAQLQAMAELFGMTIKELEERYPLMQPAERMASQMTEAGFSDHEIVDKMIEDLSRQEQALIFGEGSLDSEFSYEALTQDEIRSFQEKAARADAELRVIMQMAVGRQPTREERDEWLSEVLFLAPEQEKLGFDNYTPPRRDNVTTDEVYDTRLLQRLNALQDVVPGFGPRQ